jgi:hypothetical protein
MTKLAERMLEYIGKQTDWVDRDTLVEKARHHGYTKDQAWDALEELKEVPRLGIVWHKEERMMRYHLYERRPFDDLNDRALMDF